MDFKQYYAAKQQIVEEYLETLFTNDNGILAPYYDMLRYPLIAKSKRLRPVLILMASELFGGDERDCLELASAIELIHTYSLVHDDLPSMDDDEMRRGKPTVHIQYGEANAILVGDALLTHAFSIATKSRVHPGVLVRAIGELSDAAGISGMVGGQFLDLAHEGHEIPLDTLRDIHRHKTGALIRAACRIGAVLRNVNDEDLQRLTTYGEQIGLAFQIWDDVLDVISTAEELGKPIGSDIEKNKSTYVKFFGIDGAKEHARNAVDAANDALSLYGEEAAMLRALAEYIISRTN